MKTYITSIISLLIYSSLWAQTKNCISDPVIVPNPITMEDDTIFTTSCCNDLISTAPINPVNTERPDLLNQFDWLAPTQTLPNPNTLAINLGNGVAYAKHPFLIDNTSYSWFSSFRSGQTVPFESHIMHPKYGWELMHMNLGSGLYGDGQGTARSNPYLLFYNKYSGKLRLVVSPGFGLSSISIFNNTTVDLSIQKIPNSDEYKQSAILNRYNEQQFALDQTTIAQKVSSPLSFTTPYDWSIADFQLAYDPCSCNLPSRLDFRFTEQHFSSASMTGPLVGSQIPLNPFGSKQLNFQHDFLASFLNNDFRNNDKNITGMLVYNDIGLDTPSDYISNAMKFYSFTLDVVGEPSAGIKSNITTFGDNNNSITAGAFAMAGAGFASKRINSPASNITHLEADLSINGKIDFITNSSGFAGFQLISPGSFIFDNSFIPWDQHAFYNELPGLFALLKTPELLLSYDKDHLFGLVMDEPLQYALNPAAEIDLEESEIYAAIEFDVYHPEHENFAYYEQLQNLLAPSFNIGDIQYLPNTDLLEKFPFLGYPSLEHNRVNAEKYTTPSPCSKITMQTALVPIDRLDELRFMEQYDQQLLALNHADEVGITEEDYLKLFNFRIKILANYTFLPNAYDRVNKTVQIYTYKLGNTTRPDYLDFEECNNVPDQFCDTEGDYNQYDEYPHEGLNTVSTTDLKAFCNSTAYKASFPQTETPPIEEDIDLNIEKTIDYKLYPNPADELLNFYLNLSADAKVAIRIFDLSGRELLDYAISKQWNKGEHLIKIPAESLSPGLLLFEVCVDGNCTTEKLSVVH